MKKLTREDIQWDEVKKTLLDFRNGINIDLIRSYLGDFSDPVRIRKVSNYLTGSSFLMSRFNQMEICELMKEMKFKTRNP